MKYVRDGWLGFSPCHLFLIHNKLPGHRVAEPCRFVNVRMIIVCHSTHQEYAAPHAKRRAAPHAFRTQIDEAWQSEMVSIPTLGSRHRVSNDFRNAYVSYDQRLPGLPRCERRRDNQTQIAQAGGKKHFKSKSKRYGAISCRPVISVALHASLSSMCYCRACPIYWNKTQ